MAARECFHQLRATTLPRHFASALLVLITLVTAGPLRSAEPPAVPQPVELRGRVICLAEEMQRLHQASVAAKHEHLYGFKTADGKLYTLLRTRDSEALFLDARLREGELLLKGRVFPNSQIFEPQVLRAVKDGQVFDLFYWCDICSIQMPAPVLCDCCQGPVRLIERPTKTEAKK
jgi:hypothetical protein